MTSTNPTTAGKAILATMILAITTLPLAVADTICVPDIQEPALKGRQCYYVAVPQPLGSAEINLQLTGPKDIDAGYEYAVFAEIRNQGTTPKAITAVPFIDERYSTENACRLASISASTGEQNQDEYILMPAGDYSLRQAAAAFDLDDAAEPSHGLPMDYVRLTIGVATKEGLTGTCITALEVVEKRPLSDLAGVAAPLLDSIATDINPVPATALPLGRVEGNGGPNKPDTVSYAGITEADLAGVTKVTLSNGKLKMTTVLQNNPVNWVGMHNHEDGADWGDYLHVRITDKDGKKFTATKQAEHMTQDGKLTYGEELLATSDGRTYTRCLRGTYVDGGVYDDADDSAGGCIELTITRVQEVDPEALLAGLKLEELEAHILLRSASLPWVSHLVEGATVQTILEATDYFIVPTSPGHALYLTAEVYEWLRSAE